MNERISARPKNWILLGIPVLFGIGSGLHSLYHILGENLIIGLFAPVNESIWEHSKMVIWPVILWWLLYYGFHGREYDIEKDRWYAGALGALVTTLIAMPALYYFYTAAFGVELLWVDILILLAALALGQFLGLHIYRYGSGLPPALVILIFAAIILAFLLFTFYPPHIPLFQDAATGEYGAPLPYEGIVTSTFTDRSDVYAG